MGNKIYMTIAGKYVSLTPGDSINEFTHNCTGCVFMHNMTDCGLAMFHRGPVKKGHTKGLPLCQDNNAVWRKEEVEVNKYKRRTWKKC